MNFKHFFDADRFMPHGHCFQWDPEILWSSVTADSLIAIAYMAIPFTLVFQIMRKRKDLPFNWMFVCFGVFIVACGLTHVMEVITIWRPHYGISALVKGITAMASVPTAIILFQVAPKIVQFPSARQLVNEQTLRQRAELESQAKDRFIAVLSHELRTPLTAVKAGLDMLAAELSDSPETETIKSTLETVGMIRQNVETESVLINDLLDVSASRRGKLTLELRPVDVAPVIGDTVHLFSKEARRRDVTLTMEAEAERTVVMAAPSRVHQIVNNLLTNAFKHTPPGGHIQVKLTNERDTLQISVRDTGCGIDPEHLQRIFRPFEQGERKGTAPQEGLGLGLAIAESLARLHHGKLRAESAGRGRGSKFTLTLPLSNSFPTMAGAQMDGQIAPASNTCLRLLLVDDHLDTLEIVARLLRRSGYTVEMAQNLAEAETFLGRTDVLISDIGLPDGSGLDLMARFKSSGGLGGIAISGFGQSHDLERSRQAGFSHHLVKPLDLEALRRALASFTVKT